MELALYAPGCGYYERGGRLGTAGADFFTASDVGPWFALALARQAIEIDRALGSPDPFHVVEWGAGRGLLAADMLDALSRLAPDLERRTRYVAVDRGAGMRATAGRAHPQVAVVAPDDAPRGVRGVQIAVELFDALPVRRLRRRDGRLREIVVDVGEGGAFVEAESDPPPPVTALAERYGAAAEEGTEAEVAPGLAAQVGRMAEVLAEGVWIVVDYGDRADALYGPDRPHGTALAYHRHATSDDLLARPGEQDLTAHVNFSALEDAAGAAGLHVLGLTTQDRFLVANGLLEAFDQPDEAAVRDPRRAKGRLQAMQLIHPLGMGRRFKVLLVGAGCRPELAGLRDPFAR